MGLGGDVIVLWLAKPDPDGFRWTSRTPPGLLYTRASSGMMAAAIPAALVRGPVVAVVDNDRLVHQALALGVDEVLRVGEITAEALMAAADRARARAVGRDARPRALDGDDQAHELLGASVTFRLMQPLAAASVNLEILSAALDAVAGLADAYVRNAADKRQLLESEVQRIIAMRASIPRTDDLKASVQGVASALQEASKAVSQMYALVAPDGLEEGCDLSTVIPDIAHVVRAVVERVAEFRVEVPNERCHVQLPRSVVVQAVSALLANAIHAVGERKERGVITLRVVPRVAAALIQVIDTGVGMSPTVLERAMESFFTTRGRRAAGLGLSLAAERVRRRGGEIVLESELGTGTTACIFAPLVLVEDRPDINVN